MPQLAAVLQGTVVGSLHVAAVLQLVQGSLLLPLSLAVALLQQLRSR
jgi:hypothetical protein